MPKKVINNNSYTALFCSFLSRNRLSKTSERIAIADTISALDKHFTIQELHTYLKAHKYNTSLSTLYSNLNLLVKAGLLRKYAFDNTTPYYEKCLSHNAHGHIYDNSSQTITEFNDPRIAQIITAVERKYKIKILQHTFILYTDNQQ